MDQELEEVWEKIAEETLSKAEVVDCSLADFAEGLKDIELAVRHRREMAEDELEKSGG